MPRKQKTIDEQLAEAQARQSAIKARLHALEQRKKQRDSRTRGKAELTLMRVVLGQMALQPSFKKTIAELVTKTKLRPDEYEAVQWLIATLNAPANETGEPDTGRPQEPSRQVA